MCLDRPGEYSYENQYTRERIAFAPKEPAKPSQQSFRVATAGPSTPSAASNGGGMGSAMVMNGCVTVTKESLQLQRQKAFLAQNQGPQCGVCTPSVCVIL